MVNININTIKDAYGKTIADYSEEYFRAKERGDAAAMAAANAAANAIRSQNGVQTDWATQDIANVAGKAQSGGAGSSGYTPLNQTSHSGISWTNFINQLNNARDYAAANSDVTRAFTQDEFNSQYGNLDGMANLAEGARTTQRTALEGTANADEDLLDDRQYAAVQYEKQQWNTYNELYKQATAAGNTALAQQYLAQRDQAHTNAERIRAGAWLGPYSGGADGSMHLTYGALADNSEEMTGVPGGTGDAYNAYAEALARLHPNLYGSAGDVQTAINNLKTNDAQSNLSGLPGGGISSGSLGGSGFGSLSGSGTGGLTGKVEDYSSYLEQMYAAKKAAALAELKAAYQSNINTLERAQAGMADTYQTARNQSAGQSEVAKRNFAQYAAANGLNSGTGGQAELARNVTLQNNLNSINTAEADAVADLQLARSNAEVEYNNAIAQAQASGDYELAYALYQEKVRVQEMLIELEIREQQLALQQYQLQYQAQRDAVSDSQWAQELALSQQKYADSLAQSQNSTLASYGEAYLSLGIMPSAQMLAAMGMTQADAQKYIAALTGSK